MGNPLIIDEISNDYRHSKQTDVECNTYTHADHSNYCYFEPKHVHFSSLRKVRVRRDQLLLTQRKDETKLKFYQVLGHFLGGWGVAAWVATATTLFLYDLRIHGSPPWMGRAFYVTFAVLLFYCFLDSVLFVMGGFLIVVALGRHL
jgi:hypothetical protein